MTSPYQDLKLQQLLQGLLTDRFNLKIHHEKKQMLVYALVVSKKGTKVKKSTPLVPKQTPDGDPLEGRAFFFRPAVQPDGAHMIHLTVKNWPIQGTAAIFATILGRPVLDRTG